MSVFVRAPGLNFKMNFEERWWFLLLLHIPELLPQLNSTQLQQATGFHRKSGISLAQSEILEMLWTNHSQSVKSVRTRQNALYFKLLCKVNYPHSVGWFFSCSKSSRALTRYQARKRPLEPEQQPPTAPDAPKPGSDSEALKLLSASRV